jgi:diguanylate cyclase (GGDEF)-like protein
LSRIGGDEFAILLPSIDSREAQHVLSRIRQREKDLNLLCEDKDHGQTSIRIGMSMGVAGSDETEPERVLKLADDRMYGDKEIFYQTLKSGYLEIS